MSIALYSKVYREYLEWSGLTYKDIDPKEFELALTKGNPNPDTGKVNMELLFFRVYTHTRKAVLKEALFETEVMHSPDCEADGPRQWPMDTMAVVHKIGKLHVNAATDKLISAVNRLKRHTSAAKGNPKKDVVYGVACVGLVSLKGVLTKLKSGKLR